MSETVRGKMDDRSRNFLETSPQGVIRERGGGRDEGGREERVVIASSCEGIRLRVFIIFPI